MPDDVASRLDSRTMAAAGLFIHPDDLDEIPEGSLGGKAANLARLARAGLSVPRWFAVSTVAYREAQGERRGEVLAELVREYERMFRRRAPNASGDDSRAADSHAHGSGSDTRAPANGAEAPGNATHESGNAANAPGSDAYVPVAVRSSAVGEDGAISSFAGQMKTFLYVNGPAAFVEAVQACWESARAPGIAAYRAAHEQRAAREGAPDALSAGGPASTGGDSQADPAIDVAVVVQEMVDSEVSGVLFTANPATGDRNEMVIRAAYGLGEGVVADLVDTDGYFAKDGQIRMEVSDKAEMVARNPETGRGTVIAPVPPEKRGMACLSESQVRELVEAAGRIREYFGGHQDIEWAFAAGKLYILQTRPITTLKPPREGREIIWDNSNITESYSGVTSALTFSFASHAYDIVYRQVSELLGVDPAVVRANSLTYRNMLGLMKGRVYYNLKNWYRLVALLPGYEANKGFMEQMMGVKQKTEISASESRAGFFERWTPIAMVGARVVKAFLDLDRLVDDFTTRFYRTYEAHRHRDLSKMTPHEIVEMYDVLEREILLHWKAPIVTDIFAMVFYGVLKKLCQNWCHDGEGSLQNDLLCGEGGIESTEPTKALMRMAQMVQQDPALKAEVEKRQVAELESWLRATPGPLRDAFLSFLDRYGFRCMNELKLEEPSLRDDPTFVFVTLKNYLKRPDLDVEELEKREREIRRNAEARVAKLLGRNPLRHAIFRWVLANARKNVKNRENLRFARTKIFGLCRELFNAVGEKFVEAGVLDNPRDIYHLTVPEIWAFIEGRAVCTNLRALAALRKEEFDRYRQEEIPDRFTTVGLPHLDPMEPDDPGEAAPVVPDDDDPNILRGVSCCPGEVKGPVRVILSPRDDMALDGQILVAERTDPGWVPLYPSAAGLLIERGSILSHSAIVARELGLPAIVGIRNLTRKVRDGQVVAMDARAGIVRLNPDGAEG